MATQTSNCEFLKICQLYCINEKCIQLQLLQINRNLMFSLCDWSSDRVLFRSEIWCLLLWVAFFSHNKASTGQQLQALGQWFSETTADFSVILLLFQDGTSHYIHNQDRKKRENRGPELGHITSFSPRESWEKWFLSLQAVQWSVKVEKRDGCSFSLP